MWPWTKIPFYFSLALWAGLVALLYLETLRHRRHIRKIPLRIHVNGTRGKSSVTRLIAAGLRAGGFKVFAKTTGTSPRIILPDGGEEPLARRGPPSIGENISFLRRAAREGADAVVVECMALRPDLQWALEHRILKSGIGIITNVRADHEEVMGKGLHAVGRALALTIPDRGVWVARRETADLLAESGISTSGSRLHPAPEHLPSELLEGFGYEVFDENAALALAACEAAGVEPSTALRGMAAAAPDTGNVAVTRFHLDGKTVRFVNAFAANDPDSTLLLWNRYASADPEETILLFNARPDRRYRTMQFCRLFARIHTGPCLVTGDRSFAARRMKAAGMRNVVAATREECFEALRRIVSEMDRPEIEVFAAGNAQGMEPFLERAAEAALP